MKLDDVVIASPALAWAIPARAADFQQALAAPGDRATSARRDVGIEWHVRRAVLATVQMRPRQILNVIALVASGTLLLATMSFLPLENVYGWGWDASVYRAASRGFLAGQNPYDAEIIPEYSEGAGLATIPYFVYAPFFVVAFVPFSLLPPGWTLRLWFLANLVMVVASVGVTLARRGSGAKSIFPAVAALAFFPPLRTLLILGQSSALMLLLLTMSAEALRRRRSFVGGLILSLAFFKPHLVLVPAFLGIHRLSRALVGWVVGIAVLSLPAVMWIDDWLIALAKTRALNLSYGCLSFASVPALLSCGFPMLPFWIRIGIIGLLILLTSALCLRAAAVTSATFQLQLGLVVAMSLLVLDNVRVADLILLLYPLSLLIRELPALPRGARLAVTGLIATAYLFPYAAQAWARDLSLGNAAVWYSITTLSVYTALVLVTIIRVRLHGAQLPVDPSLGTLPGPAQGRQKETTLSIGFLPH